MPFPRNLSATPLPNTLLSSVLSSSPKDVPSSGVHGFASAAIAAGGGTGDLPGPAAAGLVRAYQAVWCASNSQSVNLGSCSAVINPGSYGINFLSSGNDFLVSFSPPVIGFGETIRVSNAGANAGRAMGVYVDMPAANITLLRTVLALAAVEIIPVPSSGYYRRFLNRWQTNGFNKFLCPTFYAFNRDSISHFVELLLGSDLVGRSQTAGAGAGHSFNAMPGDICVTDTPLNAKLSEAVSTVAPVFIGAFETLAL